MSKALEILQRNRDVILLTEIVGWLHDIDKLDERHLGFYNGKRKWPNNKTIQPATAHILRSIFELHFDIVNLLPHEKDRLPKKPQHTLPPQEYAGSLSHVPLELINWFCLLYTSPSPRDRG